MSRESTAGCDPGAKGVAERLSFLDRYLTFWIFIAMAVERLDAFRKARDELHRRISDFFAQPPSSLQ